MASTATIWMASQPPVRDGLRVSFGIYNNADDVDRLIEIVERGLRTTRGID